MPDVVLMISDLHLSDQHPKIFEVFEAFIKREACHAESLYILGDFFEAWIGDDDRSTLPKKVSRLLFALSQKGVRIYFMPGNRDFLLGRQYCYRSGITLLEDPHIVTILGHRVILSHGDLLCTDDLAYQRFRRVVHMPLVQHLFLKLPIVWRRKIANRLRMKSQQGQTKRGQWCDVNKAAVRSLVKQYPGADLVHGHTHEFKVHEEGAVQRYVLGDWDDASGSFIKITRDSVRLRPFLL